MKLEFVGFLIFLILFIPFNEARVCEFFNICLILFILFNEARVCEFFCFPLICLYFLM